MRPVEVIQRCRQLPRSLRHTGFQRLVQVSQLLLDFLARSDVQFDAVPDNVIAGVATGGGTQVEPTLRPVRTTPPVLGVELGHGGRAGSLFGHQQRQVFGVNLGIQHTGIRHHRRVAQTMQVFDTRAQVGEVPRRPVLTTIQLVHHAVGQVVADGVQAQFCFLLSDLRTHRCNQLANGRRHGPQVVDHRFVVTTRAVGHAEHAHKLFPVVNRHTQKCVQCGVTGRQTTSARVATRLVGNDGLPGLHHRAKQGTQVVELHAFRRIRLVKTSGLIVPGNVGDGKRFQIGLTTAVMQHFTDEPIFAVSQRQNVGQQTVKRQATVFLNDERHLRPSDRLGHLMGLGQLTIGRFLLGHIPREPQTDAAVAECHVGCRHLAIDGHAGWVAVNHRQRGNCTIGLQLGPDRSPVCRVHPQTQLQCGFADGFVTGNTQALDPHVVHIDIPARGGIDLGQRLRQQVKGGLQQGLTVFQFRLSLNLGGHIGDEAVQVQHLASLVPNGPAFLGHPAVCAIPMPDAVLNLPRPVGLDGGSHLDTHSSIVVRVVELAVRHG